MAHNEVIERTAEVHHYPLHTDTTAKCLCCALPYKTRFTSKTDQVVCRRCHPHLRGGQEASQRRNVDHLQWWGEYVAKVRSRHAEELSAEQHKITELQATIQSRDEKIESLLADANALAGEMARVIEEAALGPVREPNERVIKLLAGTVAEKADADRALAFRMRNSAMGRLWAVDELHHEDDETPGTCTCGLDLRQCEVYAALSPIRNALYKWEIAEADRLDRGLPHGLPREHPKVQERERKYGRGNVG